MNRYFKFFFLLLLTVALFFGFLHLFVSSNSFNYERLHIFLFNLCTGGSVIIYYTLGEKDFQPINLFFLSLSILYALCTFFHQYIAAIVIAFLLSFITEKVRIGKFGFFPLAFFKNDVRVYKKFHQASLLCLSIGLFLSGLVIINSEYHRVITLKFLKLDTFFLGFSFPVSLITMSVMFKKIKEDSRGAVNALKNASFWTVNLGVIIFFGFILMEKYILQVFVTTILFSCVITIFILFRNMAGRGQDKHFLTSGMFFLLVTSITGIIYILLHFFDYSEQSGKFLLRIHTFSALYGWNISGLAVIIRYRDFPIQLSSRRTILLHWITVMIFAPIGYFYPPLAIVATLSYFVLIALVLFTNKIAKV
ncbi:MAG: hypothetical protein GY714_10085 [Desulfobacterales bacterium]|nr:hypothetical protein [Desulfobacterales bacterium]